MGCELAKLNQWPSFPRLVTAMRRKFFVYFTSGWIIPLAASKKNAFWETGKPY
jgi:hypothetical protein